MSYSCSKTFSLSATSIRSVFPSSHGFLFLNTFLVGVLSLLLVEFPENLDFLVSSNFSSIIGFS